jgi:hypothetical protein
LLDELGEVVAEEGVCVVDCDVESCGMVRVLEGVEEEEFVVVGEVEFAVRAVRRLEIDVEGVGDGILKFFCAI